MEHLDGRKRVVIENVSPEIDSGEFPIKRTVDEKVIVAADIFADGHDAISALLLHRKKGEKKWEETPMNFLSNDRWQSSFICIEMGWYEYTIQGWIDHFGSWQKGIKVKFEANQDVAVELQSGVILMKAAKPFANAEQKKRLDKWISFMEDVDNAAAAVSLALTKEVSDLMYHCTDRNDAVLYQRILLVEVERKKALFSAWYELFPRSASDQSGMHGTFKDVENVIPMVASMGFDILYFPPIHPIGMSFRKGKDNSPVAEPGEPGSPWAIGGMEGGHKSIHPELGSLEDFKSVVQTAEAHGLEIALDLAYQCSQDHPYVKDHPQWFKWRPDGSVQYAENPPKKYQDVLPINFETDDWQNLWMELKSIPEYWIEQGVKIFRVDNPHTKPFRFWRWLIREIREKHPEVIFLAEAFTRPRLMERLGKVGFTQSYTYFTWRNTQGEFIQYLDELTRTERREYFRPNFWPNTPDILPDSLQFKNEAAFISRLTLAATLSSNYGVYGPVFEMGLNIPHPLREEYIDNEKYEIKFWDWQHMNRLRELMAAINRIRKENPALQTTWNIYFAETENDQLLCYGKTDDEKVNKIFVAVNMDSYNPQGGWIKVPIYEMGVSPDRAYTVVDLITGSSYSWNGEWNYVLLNPHILPVHIFRVEQ